MKKLLSLLLALALVLSLSSCAYLDNVPTGTPITDPTVTTGPSIEDPTQPSEESPILDPDGTYDTKEEVALYIHLYGKLPSNFMTKSEAKKQGWSGSGALSKVLPGKCIGGDVFQNREGLLPKKAGRTWTECDIGTLSSGSRGAKRIVFSNDGLIYYTGDHYKSFELLYGQP